MSAGSSFTFFEKEQRHQVVIFYIEAFFFGFLFPNYETRCQAAGLSTTGFRRNMEAEDGS